METELLIPLFWTVVIGGLVTIGLRRLSKKIPSSKKWVRPEKKTNEKIDGKEKNGQ